MTATAIIDEINQLPLTEKLLVVEKTLEAIRQEKKLSLKEAANLLYDDYKSDKELTIFTQLDTEPFYEAR
ncbi:MAG: hypothetical protein H0U39_00645 [Segetibacter sp.]|jgi:hypothetical protein|nr:hypothetical protein [Segetibacter sp.]